MIELKDGRYFKALLQFEFRAGVGVPGFPAPNADGNVLAAMWTDDPEHKKWKMVYRFRCASKGRQKNR